MLAALAVPLALFAAADAVPVLELRTLDGGEVRFPSASVQATVVLFVSTVCPVSNDYAARYEDLYARFKQKARILFVYSNKTESVDDIARHVREGRYPYPVYRDEGNTVADLLDARVTPTAVVIGPDGRVRYRGRFDDAVNPARVTDRSVENALTAVLAGKPVAAPETKPFG